MSGSSEALLLEWQPHRLFPYERRLAAREVRVLLGEEPLASDAGIQVAMNGHSRHLVRRLTYFRHVVFPDGDYVETDQWRLESGNGTRRAQSTRYSAHGLHEYKGKFNPQVVRAIGNVLGLKEGATILDPFCGSGTTLLECAHVGWNGAGVDLNPLAVFIANAKVTAIHAAPARLSAATERLLTELAPLAMRLEYEHGWTSRQIVRLLGADWQQRVPNVDYLSAWLRPSALAQFILIFDAIEELVPPPLRPVFLTIASDLVRKASLQDPGDLRIRRRKDACTNYPVLPWFLTATRQRIDRILAARQQLGRLTGRQRALEADNRASFMPALKCAGFDAGSLDGAITSPPYATALPYIDTQRLSLCLLGLIDSGSIAARDRGLTGSREIGKRQRLQLEGQFANDQTVPEPIRTLCASLLDRAVGENGFRRMNVPALVYRYFCDMQRAFVATREALAVGAPFALVVGRNRTTLSGKEIVIDTPRLLAELGAANGFELEELAELDAYQRFEMHQRNSIRSEWLVILRRVQ